MTNDNNELKNNAPCEEKQGMRELTEEELAQVSGGGSATLEVAREVAQAIFGTEQMDIATEALQGKFGGVVSIIQKPAD